MLLASLALQIVGFFIIEERVQAVCGEVGEGWQLNSGWEAAQASLKSRLEGACSSLPDPDPLRRLKDFMVLTCTALGLHTHLRSTKQLDPGHLCCQAKQHRHSAQIELAQCRIVVQACHILYLLMYCATAVAESLLKVFVFCQIWQTDPMSNPSFP